MCIDLSYFQVLRKQTILSSRSEGVIPLLLLRNRERLEADFSD